MKKCLYILFFTVFSIFNGGYSYCQTQVEIKKEADALFEQEKFLAAAPKYLILINTEPRDHDLNFRYGTCLLYSSNNKYDAIRFLSYSVKKPSIDKRAYYYLGRAYHLNYQFDNALKYYEKFKSVATTAEIKKYNVDVDIQACKNGKKLLINITDMIVIQKTEIKAEDFYNLYKLDDIGGILLVTDLFQTKYDKKVGHRPIVHFPKNSPFVYYSSYGEDGSTGLDIYVVQKLPNGKWSLPQKVIGRVNTFQDEDYPYFSPDGRYLYFASKGHNTMGGYDIFRSKYNPDDNSFGLPENMDFAICSPDDDVLYIVDSLDRIAYFSSARESVDGKLFVYKVRVEKIPMQMAVIKGDFINTINPANKEIEIIVNDHVTNSEIGKFNSKSQDGGYLVTFPKSGKYVFTMTVKGSEETHQAVITVPYLKEFRPLKMRITLVKDANGEELLKVEPLFNEFFVDPFEVMAEVYQELSKLQPNAMNYDLDSLDKMRKTDDIFVEAGLDPYLTNEDVEKVVEDIIKDLKNNIAENEKNSNIAFHLAEEKIEEAEEKMKIANNLIKESENETNLAKKNEMQQKAFNLTQEAEKAKNDAENYVALGKKIDDDTQKKQNNLILANKTLVDVKKVPDQDRMAITQTIENNKTFFENNVKNKENLNIVEKIQNEGNQTEKEFAKINNEISSLNQQKSELIKKNEKLQKDLENANKTKDKQVIENKILSNEGEIDLLNKEIENKNKEIEKITNNNKNGNLSTNAQKIQDPNYQNSNYTQNIDKNKVENAVNNNTIDKDLVKVNQYFEENNIGGKYANLTGLNENRTDLTNQEWISAIDKEINAQKNLLNKTTDPKEKEKIQNEIIRLDKLKEEKTNGEYTSVYNNSKNNNWSSMPTYDAEKDKINSITNEKDKTEALINLDKKLLTSIDKDINRIENELKSDPNNTALKNQLDQLQKERTIAVRNIEQNEQKLNGLIANNNNNNSTTGTIADKNMKGTVTSVYPTYENKIKEIQNSNLSTTEKNKQIKELNETTLNNTEEKIQETNAKLQNDPDNETYKKELEDLNTIKKNIETNPDKPLINPVLNQIDDFSALSPKVINNDINPNYDTEKQKIINSKDSDVEKEEKYINLNKDLVARIDSEIEQINNELKNNPSNKKDLQKRVKNLQKIKQTTEKEISISQKFVDENKKDFSDIIVNVETVNPNYVSKVNDINILDTDEEKLSGIKTLNNETIIKINDRLRDLDAMYAEKPTDEILDEKEKLVKLKTEISNNIEKPFAGNLDLNGTSTSNFVSKTGTITEIIPNYEETVNSLSQLNSDNDKISGIKKLNNAAIQKIDNRIEEINNELAINPNNQKAIQEKDNLIKLRTDISNNIDKPIVGNLALSTPSSNYIAKTGTLSEVNPNYTSTVNELNSLNTKEDKLNGIKKLNIETVQKIDNRINEINQELAINPNNQKAIQEKEKLIAIKEDLIKNPTKVLSGKLDLEDTDITSNNNTNNTNNTNTNNNYTTKTVTDVNPNYVSTVNSINQLNTKEEKIEEIKDLNQQTIGKIDDKISQLENKIASNPNDQTAINEKNQLTNLKKDIEANPTKAFAGNLNLEDNTTTSNVRLTSKNVTDVNPEYETRVDKINQLDTKDKKIDAIKKLNQETIKKIDARIKVLDKELAKNPSNQDAIDEKNQLTNLKKDIEANPTKAFAGTLNLEDGSTVATTSNYTTKTVTDVNPNYVSTVNSINQLNTKEEKIEEIKDLNQQTIGKIDNKISQLNNEIASNPNNQTAINEKNQLTNLKKDIEANPTKAFAGTLNLEGGSTVVSSSNYTTKTVTDVNPNYVSTVNSINQLNTKEEKIEEIKDLNQQTIGKIDDKISQLENKIASNPNDQTAINEKNQLTNLKKDIEANPTKAFAGNLNLEGIDYSTVSSNVSISDIFPEYNQKMNEINQSDKNIVQKEEDKIKVNQTLINKIDAEISNLNQYKANENPSNKKEIEKRISNLNKIKEQTEKEIQISKKIINDNKNLVGDTSFLTIEDIMPGYEARNKKIDDDLNLDKIEKLEAKNDLNKELIKNIDKKIAELETEKKNNPSNAADIDLKIQKLKELKELKLNEINKNEKTIANLKGDSTTSNNLGDVTQINENNYTTEEGKKAFNNQQKTIEQIQNIDEKISNLEEQKNNATTDKEIAKIEKQIEKETTTKNNLENNVINNLETANQIEITKKINDAEKNNAKAYATGSNDEELKTAEQKVKEAEIKLKEAENLRNEAKNEKDPAIKNQKLKQALVLEQEAKALLDDANATYKAVEIVQAVNGNNTIITKVPEEISERKSTELYNQANKIENQANEYDVKAVELREEAQKAKKKNKQALIIEAEKNEQKANDLRIEANKIKENANKIKKQEDELLNNSIANHNNRVGEDDKKDLTSSETYKNFYENKKEGDENLEKAQEIGEKIEELKQKSAKKIKMAVVIGEDYNENDAKNDEEIKRIQEEIDSLTRLQEEYKNKALQNYSEANKTINNSDLSQKDKENLISLANQNQNPTEKVISIDPSLADYTPPTKVNGQIFRTTDGSVYNNNNPIPIGNNQTEGLVYKVQFGAFKNKPGQEYFDKFAPISGEALDNGVTRYMAGYFSEFSSADNAKNQVRGMGDYKDAFVVAYYNGKRITIAEARKIEQENPQVGGDLIVSNNNNTNNNNTNNNTTNNTNTNNTTNNNTTTNNTNNNTTNNNTTTNNTNNNTTNNQNTGNNLQIDNNNNVVIVPTTQEEKNKTAYYTNAPNAAKANQVEIINGLFFTVQVGVYSKPVPASAMFNVSPLNSELTETQKIRYTSGIYTNVQDATTRKNQIVTIGVSDAFVTAYYNGKRITIAEANQLLADKGNSILFNSENNTVAGGSNNNTATENNNTSENTTNANNQLNFNKEKVYYRVLIGKFLGSVPKKYANILLTSEEVSMESFKDEDNYVYLYTSKITSFDEVRETLVELNDVGVEDMKILCYYENKNISFDNATNILNGTQRNELTEYQKLEGINADQFFYYPEAIYYKIELGKFEGEIPADFANKLLNLDEDEFIRDQDASGNQIFYSDRFESYEEAQKKMKEYEKLGFDNMDIKAYHKYKEISVKKAIDIKGK